MKKFEEMKITEQMEFTEMLWSWLGYYTDDIINEVIPKVNDILNNESAMFMLKELHLRKKEETEHFIKSLRFEMTKSTTIDGENTFHRFTTLTHSDSYKDVLEDLYIHPHWQRSKEEEENAE